MTPPVIRRIAAQFDRADYPMPASFYVDVALAHKPTLQASFTHVLNSYRYNLDRAPAGTTEATVVQRMDSLKKWNMRNKRKRKAQRRTDKGEAGVKAATSAAKEDSNSHPLTSSADESTTQTTEKKRKRKT